MSCLAFALSPLSLEDFFFSLFVAYCTFVFLWTILNAHVSTNIGALMLATYIPGLDPVIIPVMVLCSYLGAHVGAELHRAPSQRDICAYFWQQL